MGLQLDGAAVSVHLCASFASVDLPTRIVTPNAATFGGFTLWLSTTAGERFDRIGRQVDEASARFAS